MKKKFLIFILAVTAMLASISGFSACSPRSHKHFYTRQHTKEETCTEKGEWTYTCQCGSKYTAEISALGHDEITHAAKAATCTEPGWATYVTCQREGCDYSTYQGEIPVTDVHTWDKGKVTTAPTCTEAGEMTYKCTACEETKTESIEIVSHTYAQEWLSDSTHHWHECECGDKTDKESHVPSAPATATTAQVCTVCDRLLQAKTGIVFNTLAVDGLSVTGEKSNATTQFSFIDEITVEGETTYVIALDENADQTVETKIVSLDEGDNVFYVLQMRGDELVNTYTVNIRRRPMYEVTFYTNDGVAVETQMVEEGSSAAIPQLSPTMDGYTFKGWDYDFELPITENTEVRAIWSANLNTKYTVVYYLQNLEKDDYKVDKTLELAGETDMTATATIKSYEHFTYNESKSTISGKINGDGSLVLSVYYTRNSYTIVTACNNEKAGSVSAGGTYRYEEEVVLTATTKPGYIFDGWYDDKTLIGETEEFTIVVNKNATYTAKWSAATAEYTVNYYWQNVENDNYTLHETTRLTGTTDMTATATIKSYEHFTYNKSKSTISGKINGDGSLELSVYYTRNSYTIVTTCSNEKAGSVSGGGTYRYGSQITVTATTEAGYTFLGWYEGKTLAFEEERFALEVNKKTTYTAIWSVNTDTRYTVEYYLKEDGASKYTLHETVECYGETDTTVTAEIKWYIPYAYEEDKSAATISGVIAGDGSLVLKVYYVYDESLIPTLAFEEIEGGAAYKVVGIGTYKGGVLTIPATNEGKPVTTIGEEAFYQVRGIGKVVIPNSVTTIEDSAFASCLDLTEVVMGNGVTYIGKYAFAYCNQMDTITFSNKLDTIDEHAFYGCLRIKSLAFSNTLTTIEKEAFKDCKKVKSITFGTGLVKIGEGAFYRCESLFTLTIPDNAATVIGDKAFINCTSLRTVILGNAVKSIGISAFSVDDYAGGGGLKLRELVIGDSVTTIGDYAFKGSRKLCKVTVGSSVRTIGTDAFLNCHVLREICDKARWLNFTAGATTYGGIARYAFYVRRSSEETRISSDENGLVYYTDGTSKQLICVILDDTQDIVIPDDVTEVAKFACYNEQYITGVTVGDSCTTIGEKAFGNCYNIRKMDLSGSKLTTLKSHAFYHNQSVSQLIIGTSLKTVEEAAFLKKGDPSSADGWKNYMVFYEGTASQWTTFTTSSSFTATNNYHLTGTDVPAEDKKYVIPTIAYYSASKPSDTSVKYWRYVNGQPTYW